MNDLSHWYQDNVSPQFVDYRNRLMALLNQESSLLEIVKLIGSDVLPDDQKLVLEIARVIRLGFLQQNAFHKDDTCVSMEKQFLMMDTILYLYKQARTLVTMGHPMSVLKAENIFDRVISIKYECRTTDWKCLLNIIVISTRFIRMFWKRMHKENRRSCQSNI